MSGISRSSAGQQLPPLVRLPTWGLAEELNVRGPQSYTKVLDQTNSSRRSLQGFPQSSNAD